MSNTTTNTSGSDSILIGVLLLPGHQYLDQSGPVDLLGSFTPSYLIAGGLPLPAPPLPISLIYITLSDELSPVAATSGPRLVPTHTLSTCPEKLNALLIPGPLPDFPISPELQKFLDHHCAPTSGTTILCVCTGSVVLGRAGHLKGVKATSNKYALIAMLEESRAWGVKWQKEGRWVVGDNGRVWSSAGVTAGMDMVAAWLKAKKEEGGLGVDEDLMKLVFSIMEFTPRAIDDDPYKYLLDGLDL